MSVPILAIANCRVSSDEQLLNNSLARQQASVTKSATELNVRIVKTWSGSVSSKKGTNLNRKDIKEMLTFCKQNKRVKYLIVDEPDRFMRSIDEAAYFEVSFSQIGVTVWYASDPELNKGDLSSKLLKFTKYLSAEGSNEERQRKSITGQTAALRDGRYPFAPKPGYVRGYEKAIPEIDPLRSPSLKEIMEKIAGRLLTPSQGLVELNKSSFVEGRSQYKMDKFRKILTDPFYAGIVEMKKQVNFRNENGLHQALISRHVHQELLNIMNSKPKNQSGPNKNGNPDFPLSNIVSCEMCTDSSIGRFVGLKLTNGKVKANVYEKYRCRSCKRYIGKSDLHTEIREQFEKYEIPQDSRKALLDALEKVWEQESQNDKREVTRISQNIAKIQLSVNHSVQAAIDPSNISIKEDILKAVDKKKNEIVELQNKLEDIKDRASSDEKNFLDFALNFIDNIGTNFLDTAMVTPENRKRCKQLLFPAGFYVDEFKKVYTPEISPLIRLASKKKDTEVSGYSSMVPLIDQLSNPVVQDRVQRVAR